MIDWTGVFIGVVVGGFAGLLLEAISTTDKYAQGWNDALDKASEIVDKFEAYTPYIVGKLKIKERKMTLVNQIKDLKRAVVQPFQTFHSVDDLMKDLHDDD
jgi:hypothetical protein